MAIQLFRIITITVQIMTIIGNISIYRVPIDTVTAALMQLIVQIIAIIGNNWINWIRIDTVKAAVMQSSSA